MRRSVSGASLMRRRGKTVFAPSPRADRAFESRSTREMRFVALTPTAPPFPPHHRRSHMMERMRVDNSALTSHPHQQRPNPATSAFIGGSAYATGSEQEATYTYSPRRRTLARGRLTGPTTRPSSRSARSNTISDTCANDRRPTTGQRSIDRRFVGKRRD
jgi:hypothetical protein